MTLHLLKQCLVAQDDSSRGGSSPVAKVCLVLAETTFGFYEGVARRMVRSRSGGARNLSFFC